MPAEAQRLTWRFGERAIAIEALCDGMTWCLTARGKREDLVERDLNFIRAAERLREDRGEAAGGAPLKRPPRPGQGRLP